MTFGRAYHPESVKPGLAVSDSDDKRKQLAVFGKTPGGPTALKAVAAHFGIAGGRKWADLNMREVDMLWSHTVGGTPLPQPVDESIVWTSDETPEGRAFNAKIPF